VSTRLTRARRVRSASISGFRLRSLRRDEQNLCVLSVSALKRFLPPLQGLLGFVDVNPGRRSQTRFALGYYLSGFQPFESAFISVNQRLNSLRSRRLCLEKIASFDSELEPGRKPVINRQNMLPRVQEIVTGTSVIVSLPKISITFTAMM